MNQYLLYVSPCPERKLPPWHQHLFKRSIVVLAVRSLAEALQYCKVYSVMMVMLEIEDLERELETVRATLAEADPQAALPPLVGIMPTRPGVEEMTRLAEAGVVDLIAADDPEPFILWRLDLLHHLHELARFEKSRIDVNELARRTRVILHDMSQPLSAVQGGCNSSPPNAPPTIPTTRPITTWCAWPSTSPTNSWKSSISTGNTPKCGD